MSYKGSCHCGNIAYEVEGTVEQVMECNCSLCSRRGYLLWFVPRASLKLSTPASNLSTYLFNKRAIKHHYCAACGCAPFGMGSDGKGQEMVAVNVRCLEGVDLKSLTVKQVDGRSL